MTRGDHNAELVPIALSTVRPYVSVVVLEPRNSEVAGAFDEVRGFLRMPTSSRTRAEVALFAEGFDVDVTMTGSIRDTVGLVHRISSSPSWQVGQGPIRDLRHVLTLIARSDELIAVLVDRMWSDPCSRGSTGRAGEFDASPTTVCSGPSSAARLRASGK